MESPSFDQVRKKWEAEASVRRQKAEVEMKAALEELRKGPFRS